MNFNEFYNMIKSLDPNTSIGVHGVKVNTLSNEDISKKIIDNGLNIYNWGGLLSTIKMYGRVKDLSDDDIKDIYNYSYGINENGKIVNFVFGFPEIITNSNNKSFYLGYYNKYDEGETIAGSNLPLNNLFDKTRLIPSDFIIGSVIQKENIENIDFIMNNKFYGFNNNQDFYDNLFNELKKHNILNFIEAYEYLDLLSQYGIDFKLIKDQYEEYLSKEENKSK